MRSSKFKNLVIPFLLAIILMDVSNTYGQSERKLAKNFVKLSKPANVLLLLPQYIYKFNRKTQILDNLSYHSQQEKDELLWEHSKFIRFINDSVLLSHFVKGYSKELGAFGFKVFLAADTDRFYLDEASSYRIKLEQMELEEQYYPYTDSAFVDNQVFVFRKRLEALDVSVWLKIGKQNAVRSKLLEHKVLFAENLLTDQVSGEFIMDDMTGKLQYFYRMDSLTVKKIYSDVEQLGSTYADYTFDYLMNQYLNTHLEANKRNNNYWRYDPFHHRLFLAGDDRLLPLK